MKKILSLAIAACLFVVAGAASAQSAAGYAGVAGGIVVVGGYGQTSQNAVSHSDGNSSSDVGGGSMATGSVYGTGAAYQGTTNNASSWASSAGQNGVGYANTATSGGSTTQNYTAGITVGSGTGHSEGQAGADYSAKANGSFSVDYASHQVAAGGYLGGAIGVGAVGGLSYGNP